MQDKKSVSLSVINQIPEFIKESNPLFEKFLDAYYKSQEKTGGALNIINNLTEYFDIDSFDLSKINGNTTLITDIDSSTSNIEVETTDGFLDRDGSIIIDDEVIYYEEIRKSPTVAFSPGLSYTEFNKKLIILSNPYRQFDGIRTTFELVSNNEPIFPISANHLLVKLYGEVLVPNLDYIVVNNTIIFSEPPRVFDALGQGDDAAEISIYYMKGFETNEIFVLNSSELTSNKFRLTRNNQPFIPSSNILTIVIADGKLLTPEYEFSIFNDTLILNTIEENPTVNYVAFINYNALSVGSGCVAYSVINENSELDSIRVRNSGSGYTLENSPNVSLVSDRGTDGTAKALVNGLKDITLLQGGFGYSPVNPPRVVIQSPNSQDGIAATATATVNSSGSVESITLVNSGSGYDFIPRIQFINPSGAEVSNVQVDQEGRIVSVDVISSGSSYTNAPEIYIDDPISPTGIKAVLRSVLNSSGEVVSVDVLNQGTGYSQENPPRVKIIQPAGAQILDVQVDSFGRVINIDLLFGGSGYENVPSVYIVDDRKDNLGNPIGGTGATAVATIFNNQIIDISITNFGTGYSSEFPPKIYISTPEEAKASATIGNGEITGFQILNRGSGYTKSEFIGCSRGVSGITGFTDENKVIFSSEENSIPAQHTTGSQVKSLDSIFLQKILRRLVEQYLPGLPDILIESLNVGNVLRTAKDFYASKGTQFAVKYLFNLLYNASVDVSYPKDQIIKPSASSWSVDTVLRAKLISGDPENLSNGLLEQEDSEIDTNISYAQALIENYIAIQTPKYDVYELILSEESINGTFVIPYKTKLTEKLLPTDVIITVDSTIGWPERNGEVLIGNEVIRYKEKSLTQFIECTRGVSGIVEEYDSGTDCNSNFYVYVNKGTPQEVVLSILGIIEANKTQLLDDGSYYLAGDKLTISKLGSTEDTKLLTSWLYNVKKLLEVESITYGGLSNQTATVVCNNEHGLLIGDQVTIYGANPIVYNGTFLVTSIPSRFTFTYTLPQPANLNPQGNILISIDLNKGKSDSSSINTSISRFATNVQNTFFNSEYVYVAASGIPNYKIGPFLGTALLPGNQRKLNRFSKVPKTISLKELTKPGPLGTYVNGVSVWNYKSEEKYPFGPLTGIKIVNSGEGYDAVVPPVLTVSGGSGTGAEARVVVNGSISEIEVESGGSGYTSSPLVSISGGGGEGASATAIITNGSVSRILINTPGTGFTSEPVVNISGGGGSGATAKAFVRGPISNVVITSNGNGYTSNPTISLSSGEGAAAEAYVNNGRIISISVIASGIGYTTAPRVIITGDGFGAVAKATISTEGSDAGKVIGIQILNRGIGYRQGTTLIRLESIGEGASFESSIFEWTFNLNETTNFDYANGSIFEGYNKQFGGEYGHISNPKQLRYVLGDNLDVIAGEIVEKESGLTHSPIIGWAFDGNPIYGPYGLSDPTNINSQITQIKSGYRLKPNLVYDEILNINPERIDGPSLFDYPAGTFIEDYEYVFRSESIYVDEYNGRFTKTPDFPDGVYAYFATINTDGSSAFPYIIGPNFYSIPDSWNLNQFAIQSQIPRGIVRYRDPFENVDIDIQRQANEQTNALTLENGDFLTFDVEDENRDGLITDDEIRDPDIIFEEDKLEIFDYFPKIELASKVDIEVETTTKFEDAKISEFLIENPGINYQVGDVLIFDDAGTDGYGASASVSKILGETVSNYTYRYNENTNEFEGVLTTEVPHNLESGDSVEVLTVPQMEPASKTIKMITVSGLESIGLSETGIGYGSDIPVEIVVDSTSGKDTQLEPVISSTGILEKVNIINSGNSYDEDPKIRITHPQIQTRSNYFSTILVGGVELKIADSLLLDTKEFYVIGYLQSSTEDKNAILAKFNSQGFLIWQRSLSSQNPSGETKNLELVSIAKNDNSIFVVGQNRPNVALSNSFNPDIVVARYDENDTGTEATLVWQKQYGGISGASRADYPTDITIYNDNILVCGYTSTNSYHVHDAFVMYIAANGDSLARRKITSPATEDRFYSVRVDSNGKIYLVGNSGNNLLVSSIYIIGNRIYTNWVKEYTLTDIKLIDQSMVIDEFNEIYILGTQQVVSNGSKTKIGLIKLDSSGNILDSHSYNIISSGSIFASKASLDVFGEINIAVSVVDDTDRKYIVSTKIKYDGSVISSNKIESSTKEYGYDTNVCISDVSGDPFIFGSFYRNRTQFLFDGEDYLDKTERQPDLVPTGSVTITSDSKYGSNAYSIPQTGKLTATLSVDSSSWTLEKWIKWDSAATARVPVIIRATDGVNGVRVVVFADSGSPSTYGKVRLSNDAASISQLTAASTYVNDLSSGWVHIALKKEYSVGVSIYKLIWNGTQIATISENVDMNPTTIEFGSSASTYTSWPMKVDDIRFSDYSIQYSGLSSIPSEQHSIYDYNRPQSFVFKFDKNSDSVRMGVIEFTNCQLEIERSTITLSELDLEFNSNNYALSLEGFQVLDFTEVSSTLQQNLVSFTTDLDLWSSRTSTIPSPGGRKPKFVSKAYEKFFFKIFSNEKVDNVRRLTINQDFNVNVGSNIIQKNSIGSTIASAKIISIDSTNRYIYTSALTGSFSENTGYLETSDEVVNEISGYLFSGVDNTTPGTFVIDIPVGLSAIFKDYSDEDYQVRIDEIIPGSAYSRGSVYALGSSFFSFNSSYTQLTISGLSSVTKISLTTNLKKVLQITDEYLTNTIYVRSATSHYLNVGDILFNATAPEYSVADGSFFVKEILSKKEFLFDLNTTPGSAISSSVVLNVYVKHPIIKLIYGQQYVFDTSDPSNVGRFLSFYRDNLNKIEYTFKNIIRKGTPGIDEPGNSPFISFKVTDDVSNISYYADPSRIGENSPVGTESYIDVIPSPYIGTFEVKSTEGASVTVGANKIVFPLKYEPEKAAIASLTSYTTTSRKAVGSIGDIRLVSGGGFYKKLPIITDIQSSRKIERVEIIEPGTEYEAGEYFGVPILGDGNGGRVRITVDGTSDPAGQIVEVVVTDPGKGYTTAYIDVDAIDGILGPTLSGSGAELNVVIPPKGSGASIFVKGERIGKIKKLKNNNFGFDYTHDYTLRPEITFPVNLQLTSTSILSSIKVIDPGTGYTSPPEVIITGGGGSGATAEALLRNGRINGIQIKNPGSGYTVEPEVSLKSSFNYVVNLDLGLFQFAYPHGITNGSIVTFDVVDLGEGAEFPLTSFGFLNRNQVYYAIAGESAGLEDDQLRIALTPIDAETGNYISFVNTGIGRQVILTDSFGGSAEAILETARFLSGEIVFQGPTYETATAIGYVSENEGWQVGPRLLKLINYTGDFEIGERVTGLISKASGIIGDINIAKGVLEVDSITRTTGKFLDDIGKPSEIIQKVQDSYLYQMFSYNIKSPISIDQWKKIVVDNIHPAGFKIFGEIGVSGGGKGLTDRTDFELVKSVNLIESSVVSNIDNFALVEPVYSEFDNTQVLFRNKRLTSSEEILTSVVQKIDDISYLFDGARTVFPLTIDGVPIIAQSSQFMIVINGISQAPGTSFTVQQGNIVFSEPPPAPTKISYAVVELEFKPTSLITLENISGIIPELGNTVRGLVSNASAIVASSTSTTLTVFNTEGTFLEGETIISSSTGLNANVVSIESVANANVYRFQEKIRNLRNSNAVIEEINLDSATNTVTNFIVISKTSGTYDSPSGLLDIDIDDFIVSAETQIVARVTSLSAYRDPNVYIVINPSYEFTGNFVQDEIVIGSTSGATGEVVFWNPDINRLILKSLSGTFVPNEIIIGQTSTANHKILTTTEIEPTTSITISDPSRFYGLLFNRIVNPTTPNVIVDDISRSVIEVVDINDNSIKAESKFVDFESINNILVDYENPTADLLEGEFIQNIKINYTNQTDHFTSGESIEVRKLSYYDLTGGNFQQGDTVIGSVSGASANIIGINYALKILYLGQKTGNFISGETITSGAVSSVVSSYFTIPFDVNQLNTTSRVITTSQIYEDTQHRFRDAANLLRLNSQYIVEEAAGRLKNRYPDLVIPGDTGLSSDGTNRCKLDLTLLLQAVISDIENGGNYESITAARFYIDQNGGLRFIERQVLQSVYAHTQMNDLCQKAIIGELSETPEYTDKFPIPPIDITVDAGDCANVRSAIDSLWNSINDVISPTGQVYRDAADLIWFNRDFIAEEAIGYIDNQFTYTLNGVQYKAFQYPGGSSATCKRDLVDYILPSILSDLVSGGDANTIDAVKFYIGAGNEIEYVKNELLPTVVALEKANELCQYAIDNWQITGTNTEYFAQYGATSPKYKDLTITVDDGTYGGDCANIKSAIDILFQKAIDALIPTTEVKRNAAKLILFNKNYIQFESLQRTLNNFPGFSIPGGNSKCLRDIGYIIDAIVYDLLTDGTSAIYESTVAYIDAATGQVESLQGELIQSIYAYQQVRDFMKQAVAETLTSPSTAAGFYSYTDTNISITGADLTLVQNFIDNNMSILLGTLNNSDYIETNSIIPSTSVVIPTTVYPTRSELTPIQGGLREGDYLYGTTSNENAEVSLILTNRGYVKKNLLRLEVEFANPTEVFGAGDVISVFGQPSRTATVYSVYYSENINYIDIEVISGPFNVSDIILDDNNFTAEIISIENRAQLINLIGTFVDGDYIRAPRSTCEASITNFENNSSPVLDTTGGRLTLETEFIEGSFHVSNVVYSSTSNYFIDVISFEGTQISIGDLVKTTKIYRITIDIPDTDVSKFVVGETVFAVIDNLPTGRSAKIVKYEEVGGTKYLYVGNFANNDIFENGDDIAYYEGANQYPSGFASVVSVLQQDSVAYAYVERVESLGLGNRIYLRDVKGTFEPYAQLIADNYRSVITNVVEIVGRVSRSFRGFDGVQTQFKLTSNNGLPYFPDADGHVLVYVNGVLQPVEVSYTTFSDIIQFYEPPELGASFHATYIGKLRKLDDISFEFDSLRNSFNLKLNEVFYSLTVTEGVQSTNIRPENNIIVSLNGVIQEPGVAFEIVGSRINFAEIPRSGSTFVAYSYIGSDADVIAATVIPPIESGDQLLIEGEDQDRTVAVVESSNSLITFDYLGSIFGRNGSALANLITGRVKSVQLTSGGDGYTSRPVVSLSSATGFDAQVKALVGVSRVDVIDRGSNYKYPEIEIVTEIEDFADVDTFDSSSATFDVSSVTFDAT